MSGLQGSATFEQVFIFNRCLRQGSIKAPKLWQMIAMEVPSEVEKRWRESVGVLLDLQDERAHQTCSMMWADNFWLVFHTKKLKMLQEIIEEVVRWGLLPKVASLWWTSTSDEEEKRH